MSIVFAGYRHTSLFGTAEYVFAVHWILFTQTEREELWATIVS